MFFADLDTKAPAVQEKPVVLGKTKSGRVTKNRATPATGGKGRKPTVAKKAAAAAAPKKKTTPKKATPKKAEA